MQLIHYKKNPEKEDVSKLNLISPVKLYSSRFVTLLIIDFLLT